MFELPLSEADGIFYVTAFICLLLVTTGLYLVKPKSEA